jgi:hypothetical protein
MAKQTTFEAIVLEDEARAVLEQTRFDEEAQALIEESRKPNRRADRKVEITVRCSPEVREQIREHAAARGMDMNSLILFATDEWLANNP